MPIIQMTVRALPKGKVLRGETFSLSSDGLRLTGGNANSVDEGEALEFVFGRDVIVESAEIVVGRSLPERRSVYTGDLLRGWRQ
jgi:hypothetical protein